MNIVDYLISSISALPLIVMGPGLALCAFIAFRAFGFFLSLRWIRAVTHLVYIAIILLVMARYGQDIAVYLQSTEATASHQQNI